LGKREKVEVRSQKKRRKEEKKKRRKEARKKQLTPLMLAMTDPDIFPVTNRQNTTVVAIQNGPYRSGLGSSDWKKSAFQNTNERRERFTTWSESTSKYFL